MAGSKRGHAAPQIITLVPDFSGKNIETFGAKPPPPRQVHAQGVAEPAVQKPVKK